MARYPAPCLALLVAFQAHGRTLHVSKAGQDGNPGTASQPYLTIGLAAKEAQPGDTVLVHAGTYREAVRPALGGTSESMRIVYRALPGEKVIIKGSERILGWISQGGGVWKADLPASLFAGGENPYTLTLTGDYLTYGNWHHRGDVYLDEKGLVEVQTAEEARNRPLSWFVQTQGGTTTLLAHFGSADPNSRQAEVNVRSVTFAPAENFRNYITVEGFTFMHTASNWGPPNGAQEGALWTRGGHHWIIQDNTVIHSRTIGISIGIPPDGSGGGLLQDRPYGQTGHHIIRRNAAFKCGQAGIAGKFGATASLVSGNHVDSTNYRDEFGGHDVAGMKFHWSMDAVIAGNTILRTRGKAGNYGIWIDFGNQNTRVTGNLLADHEGDALFMEANHGPILVDNNLFIDCNVRIFGSSAVVLVHNLFWRSSLTAVQDPIEGGRSAGYFVPHTRTRLGSLPNNPIRDIKVFNNIFIAEGASGIVDGQGNDADFNLFLDGARKSRWDRSSLSSTQAANFAYRAGAGVTSVSFSLPREALSLPCPLISRDFLGVFAKVNQGIENPDGTPVVVDRDFLGRSRAASNPKVGPFEALQGGTNTFEWGRNPVTAILGPSIRPVEMDGPSRGAAFFGLEFGTSLRVDALGRRLPLPPALHP